MINCDWCNKQIYACSSVLKFGENNPFSICYECNTKDLIFRALMEEKENILNWMNATPHPSRFTGWNDSLDRLSKQWTEKENRLKEVKAALQAR
jgi:hypothetical protein